MVLQILRRISSFSRLKLNLVSAHSVNGNSTNILLRRRLNTTLTSTRRTTRTLLLNRTTRRRRPSTRRNRNQRGPKRRVARPNTFRRSHMKRVMFQRLLNRIKFSTNNRSNNLTPTIQQFRTPNSHTIQRRRFNSTPLNRHLFRFTMKRKLSNLNHLPMILRHRRRRTNSSPMTSIPLVFLFRKPYSTGIISLRGKNRRANRPITRTSNRQTNTRHLHQCLTQHVADNVGGR